MIFVRLTKEEKDLSEYFYKTSTNSVVRKRCLGLLYSYEGRSIKDVSNLLHVSRHSLECMLCVWESSDDK